MRQALCNIFRHANHIQPTHTRRQEHHCQHPVLRFTHGLRQGVVILNHAIFRFHFLIRRVFHQRGAKDDHHQHNRAPNHEGFFQTHSAQQLAVDEFKTEAAKTVRTDGKGGNQPFTLREPFYTVGKC